MKELYTVCVLLPILAALIAWINPAMQVEFEKLEATTLYAEKVVQWKNTEEQIRQNRWNNDSTGELAERD